MTEIESLARAAVRRAKSLYLIVLVAILAISTRLLLNHLSLAKAPGLAFWFCGATAILVLGAIWVRNRVRQANRLQELYRTTEGFVARVEVLHIRLLFIPLGTEIGLRLEPNEFLTLGFWRDIHAERLVELLELKMTPRAREEIRWK